MVDCFIKKTKTDLTGEWALFLRLHMHTAAAANTQISTTPQPMPISVEEIIIIIKEDAQKRPELVKNICELRLSYILIINEIIYNNNITNCIILI